MLGSNHVTPTEKDYEDYKLCVQVDFDVMIKDLKSAQIIDVMTKDSDVMTTDLKFELGHTHLKFKLGHTLLVKV